MGPSGCGKSTIAGRAAKQRGEPYIEGDDHHPPENRAKMASGRPLTDEDRVIWLDNLQREVAKTNADCIWLACSALTPFVQMRLQQDAQRTVRFVLLDVPVSMLEQRLRERSEHFMPPELLQSQIDALVPPENALRVDASRPQAEVIKHILQLLDH